MSNKLPEYLGDDIKGIVSKYAVNHSLPSGVTCRCLDGAPGHLVVDIMKYLSENYTIEPKKRAVEE